MSEMSATGFSVGELLEIVNSSQAGSARLAAAREIYKAVRSGMDVSALEPGLRVAYGKEMDLPVATQLLKTLNNMRLRQKCMGGGDLSPCRGALCDNEEIRAALVGLKGLYARSDKKRAAFERRYEMLGVVGEGGMGKVFKARDGDSGELVAIKYLADRFLKNENVMKRFKREFDVLESLSHPGLVRVHEYGAGEGEVFIVMDYVDGPTLERVVDNGGMSAKDFVVVLKKLCPCFEYLHAQGLVHRDVKPGNILLEGWPGSIAPRLVDFGLVKVQDGDGLTKTSTHMGTIEFLAPEQLANARDVGPQCDIYSLGVTAYYILSQGRLPAGDYPLLHELDPALGRIGPIVEKCLNKRPEDRWPSMAALLSALEGVADESLTVCLDEI